MAMPEVSVAAFYKFIPVRDLSGKKERILRSMRERGVFGTVILAEEGVNSTVAGGPAGIRDFIAEMEALLGTDLAAKVSTHEEIPFRRQKVKIKKEIVTLRQDVDIELGRGTYVSPEEWNRLISDPETVVLDTRNDYEVRIGKFRNAVDPKTESFCDLPRFVEENLDPADGKKIAMYCTGGIRCEKFAPYMKQLGFEEVYQLEGGILRYLEETESGNSLWEGECFVFDERISVDEDLRKGSAPDHSFEKNRKS